MTNAPKGVPCMFCGSTDGVEMRKVYGLHLYMVAACDLCVERVKAVNHPIRETWVLTAHGATHVMNRIEKLEGLTKAIDWNEMPIKRAQASADGWDGKSVVSVDGLPTRPVPIRVPGEPGYYVRLEIYNYLVEKHNELLKEKNATDAASAGLLARLMDWRNSHRVRVSDAGKHNCWWAKVPEGEL